MPKSSPTPSRIDNDTLDDSQGKPSSSKSNLLSKSLLKKSSIKQDKSNKTTESVGLNVADILDTEFRGISLYAVAMLLLVLAILWTGVNVVEQIQTYHQQYGELQKLKKQFKQLQMEHQRMLIEQQTFSATPQVTHRAVTELNMFYPDLSDRLIIHANGVESLKPDNENNHLDNQQGNQIDPETQH